MTKEEFEIANELYDYITDAENSLNKLERLKKSMTVGGRLCMFWYDPLAEYEQKKQLSEFLRVNDIRPVVIPGGLEFDIVNKTYECLSKDIEDSKKEFAAL